MGKWVGQPNQLFSSVGDTSLRPLRVLIVSDYPQDCQLWLAALRRAGWNPEWRRLDHKGDVRGALEPDTDLILSDSRSPHFSQAAEWGLNLPLIALPSDTKQLDWLGDAVQRALRQQQEQDLLQALESAPAAVLLADSKGQLLACNQAGLILLGYAEQDFRQFNIVDLYPVAQQPRARLALQSLRLKGSHAGEVLLQRGDGEGIWVSLQAVRLAQGCVFFLQDLSQRQAMDKQRGKLKTRLRLSKRLEAIGHLAGGLAHDFKNLLQLICFNATLLDGDNPDQAEAVAQIMQAVDRATGLTQQLVTLSQRKAPPEPPAEPAADSASVERTPLRLLLVEDDEADGAFIMRFLEVDGFDITHQRVDGREAMHKALADGHWDAIISDHDMPRFSGREALELYHQSGLDIPFLVVSGKIGEETAIEYMKAGAHDYLFKGNLARLAPALRRELQEASLRREGVQAEESRRESQARYQQIVEAATEGIFIADTRLRLTFANRRLGEILADEPANLIGKTVFSFISPEDRDVARRCWKSLTNPPERPLSPTVERHDMRQLRGDGSVVWTRVSVRLLKDHLGHALGTLGMVTDITERRLLQERILLAEVEKRRFCRQVLQAVTGGKFQLVDSSELPDLGEVFFEVALDGEEHYRQLLHKLWEFSLERGFSEDAASEFTLAVGEAATNVVKHARDGLAQIGLRDGLLTTRISDHGSGIRAEDLPASILQAGFSTAVSLGMGYTLMLAMSDTVWLASDPGGTVVQLERSLLPPNPLDSIPELALLDRFG